MLHFKKHALISWKFKALSKTVKREEREADYSLSSYAEENVLTLAPLPHTSPRNSAQATAELYLDLTLCDKCSEDGRYMEVILDGDLRFLWY